MIISIALFIRSVSKQVVTTVSLVFLIDVINKLILKMSSQQKAAKDVAWSIIQNWAGQVNHFVVYCNAFDNLLAANPDCGN